MYKTKYKQKWKKREKMKRELQTNGQRAATQGRWQREREGYIGFSKLSVAKNDDDNGSV